MKFSHVLLTRPQPQSEELAALLEPLGFEVVVQPAFTYSKIDAREAQHEDCSALASAGAGDLLLFTSPRAVSYGLAQIPAGVVSRTRVAAIGPSTEKALANAGIRAGVRSTGGYTSEALLETLNREGPPVGHPQSFIMAAPGGRKELAKGMRKMGWTVRVMMVYRPEPAPIDRQAMAQLGAAGATLSVWTSGNAMKALSQRLPPAAWFRVCQGDWLVISSRLRRLARAYGPENIHKAKGPDNQAIFAAIRNLC